MGGRATTMGGGPTTMGGATMGGAGGAAGSKFPCLSPKPLPGGFETCSDGTTHRPHAVECKSQLPRAISNDLPAGPDVACHADSDCIEKPHGMCMVSGDPPTASYCDYGCVNDSECVQGVCQCGEAIGHCAMANCHEDAECGVGLRCQSYAASPCGAGAFTCQTANDNCSTNFDCGPTQVCEPGTQASAVPTGWGCKPMSCAVGRPFLVSGTPRVAGLVPSHGWAQAPALRLAQYTTEQRRVAAEYWLQVARLEHASIAAFARFGLQLLQLAAPPQLVELATAAIADETRHARLAFGIAEQLSDEALGPGALDVQGSLLETSLVDVVRLVVREGCVGETGAALEAREAALAATEPALAQLLHDIADDESRHAELAFRFVAWALEREPSAVAAVLREELEREQARLAAPVPPSSADELAALEAGRGLGVVPAAQRRAKKKAALSEVILPCAQALLARAAAAPPRAAGLSA